MREDECPHFRAHILIMLLANDCRTQQQIADFIGCSLRTVSHWFIHGDPDNLESFRDTRAKGNNQKATPAYTDLLIEVVDKDPIELGYEFGRWMAQRLSEHLAKKTEIAFSSGQVKRLLKKTDIVWQKYSLEERQNPQKCKVFKEKLERWMGMEKKNQRYIRYGFGMKVVLAYGCDEENNGRRRDGARRSQESGDEVV